MADPDALKRALARLVDGTAAGDRPGKVEGTGLADHRRTVAEAVAAVDDLEAAADFADAGGVEELATAVDALAAAGDDAATDGRTALEAFRSYRRAANGDHFRSGRGTPLGSGGKTHGR